MKWIPAIVLLITTVTTTAFSQNNLIDFWKSEKLKLTPEQVEKIRVGELTIDQLKNEKLNDEFLADGDNEIVTIGNNPESEITAAINPNNQNNMVVSAIRYTGSGFECPIYYTTDFGANWSTSNFTIAPSTAGLAIGGGDPVFCYGPGGTLYYSWIMVYIKSSFDSVVAEMRWAYSVDDGKSWNLGDDSFIGRSAGRYAGSFDSYPYMFDKQWMVCDNSNSSNRGNLYVSLSNLPTGHGDAGDFSTAGIYVGVKKANETKFNRKLVLISSKSFSQTQFSSIDCDSHGRVYVSFWAYVNSKHSLWCVYSDDAFQTVSEPVKITDFKFNANNFLYPDNSLSEVSGLSTQRAYPYPQIKVDKSGGEYDGNVYVTWCGVGIGSVLNNGMDVYCARSTDRGVSWSEPQSLNFDSYGKFTHQFYPTLEVNSNGVVAVTYYDDTKPTASNNTDYVTSVSLDGGVTFNNRKILSDQQTNFGSVGLLNSNFGIGEYNGLVSTNDYIIPYWCDGRGNNGRLKIYTTKCNISTIPPVTDVQEELKPINGDVRDLIVNYANGNLNLQFNSNIAATSSYIVSDISGKKVSTGEFNATLGNNNLSIEMPATVHGAYFIALNFDGEYHAKKFLVPGM